MKYFPHILLILYIAYFIVLWIDPYSRDVWVAENLPIVLIVLLFVCTYKKFNFSNLSYFFISFLLFLHTTWGHFTFEKVPFDFITDLFNFERNHFDRIAHFSVWFYAYPIAELLFKKKLVNSKTILILFPIFSIVTVAAFYELIEWVYAVKAWGEAWIAFLWSQWDIWDAQKDILADTLWAVFVMTIFMFNIKK